MVVNRFDINQTLSFSQRCAAIDNQEIDAIVPLIEPGTVAVDIGTCFGAWTLEFAKRAGAVYSFEAQRYLYNCLCGSLAMNCIEHVFPYNVAVGATTGVLQVPRYDLGKPLQYGCVYLCDKTNHGQNTQDPIGYEPVRLVTLDSFNLSNISLIKIDVEGMEIDVLRGATETIKNNRPALYIEMILNDAATLKEFIESVDYVYTDNGANMLALPKEKYTLTLRPDQKTLITKL